MHKHLVLAAVGLLLALALAASGGATVPGPNGLIAFRANTGNGNQIYTIRPDGTDQRQLTNLAGDALQPHWAPESNRITFEFDPANPDVDGCAHVAYMNRNGGGLKILPLANGDICEGAPTFSAGGQRIFYEGYDGDTRDVIWSMKLNGKERQLVTGCQGQGVTDPEVSPDGTMLSFTCFSDEGQALFDSRIDGSELRQLTPFSFQVGVKADWSPDSERIMFLAEKDEATNTATIRRDGTGLTWVTNYPAGGTRAFGNSYSPDGQWIVLRLEQDDLYAMYKIHPDGTGLTQVTQWSTFRPRGMAWGSALANAVGTGRH